MFGSRCLCMPVCLSCRISQKPHNRTLTNFLCIVLVAVAWLCDEYAAIRYLLPVLWMASCLHISARQWPAHAVFLFTCHNDRTKLQHFTSFYSDGSDRLHRCCTARPFNRIRQLGHNCATDVCVTVCYCVRVPVVSLPLFVY